MHWSFVVVHILIIAVISYDSFPIDLKEIEPEDVYLVDKQRKGRFIQVNQTTFLPNPIESLRAKKSSEQIVEKSDDMVPEGIQKDERKLTPHEANLPITHKQIPFIEEELMARNNYTCADSLFEPQTFGYPSFFEDKFNVGSHTPYFSNPMLQMFTDDNCNCDKFMGSFTSGFPCIEEFVVPQENLLC